MRTIDITTTQNVTIQYELSALKDRFLAWMIDMAVIVGSMIVISIIMGIILQGSADGDWVFMLVLWSIFMLYTLVSEIIMNGQTIGKKALNLKVVKLNGKEPGLSDYLIRWMFRSVDIYASAGAVGALLVSASGRSQRLGGLLSNTTVIKVKPVVVFSLGDILKIDTVENYTPQYPDIRHFDESDMLMIKSAIDRWRKYPNVAHQKALFELNKKMAGELGLTEIPKESYAFLRTLVSDYIVLTR